MYDNIPWYDLVMAIFGVPFAAFVVWLPHGIGHVLDRLDEKRVHNGKNRDRHRREFER